MLGALRLKHGFTLTQFTERTGLPPSSVRSALDEAQTRGLLHQRGDHISPSAKGYDFLSDLQAMFLPPETPTLE
jgi:coproporphyrinogen III oxidase-like Fe-S oxidoreductase